MKKFRCIDDEISIMGNFDSNAAQQFVIQFEKCDRTVENNTCKTDEEINAYLEDKFIMILHNERRFMAKAVGSIDEVIVKESRLVWIPIDTVIRQSYPF